MINLRLKEERERLNLSQTAFGELANSAKRTVIDWEKGVSSPNAVQMSALAAAGADVLYILTGQRMAGAVPALSRDEAIVLDHYRHCDDDGKAFMKQAGAVASKPKAKKASGE
jgi:transcriptional regulator with XRE-family HTH domain